jgi:hypothetical protein
MKAAAVLGFIMAKPGSTLRKEPISRVQPARTATPTRIAARLQYLEMDLKGERVPDLPGGMELPSRDQVQGAPSRRRAYPLASQKCLNRNGPAVYFTGRDQKRLINFAEF